MFLTKYGRFWAVYDAGALGPRVHSLARHFLAGKTLNGLVAHEDWVVTCLAAAGAPDIKEQLLKGGTCAGRQYRAPPDEYNQLGYRSGKTPESPRKRSGRVRYSLGGAGLGTAQIQEQHSWLHM